MSSLCALSIVTAVLCGIWSYLAGIAGLIGWAGFAGCTTYPLRRQRQMCIRDRGKKDHDYESDRRPMWNDDHHT